MFKILQIMYSYISLISRHTEIQGWGICFVDMRFSLSASTYRYMIYLYIYIFTHARLCSGAAR